jgi:hypothetical protein
MPANCKTLVHLQIPNFLARRRSSEHRPQLVIVFAAVFVTNGGVSNRRGAIHRQGSAVVDSADNGL